MSNSSLGALVLNNLFDDTAIIVEKVYGGLMGAWPAQTIVGIYVIFVGYQILMGRAGDKSKEWGISAVLLLVLGGVAGNYGTFTEWVIVPIWSVAQRAGGMAASGGDVSTGILSGILDASEDTLGKILTVIDRVEVLGSFLTNAWLYIKVGVVLLVLGLLSCAQYLVTLTLLCIAGFSLLMMFMVGGVCLWFASFKETRFITWTWLKQTLNYALWIFFIGAVAGVGNSYSSRIADKLTSWDLASHGVFTEAIGASMVLSCVSIYMLLKASDWAAALTGGSATNTGIVGAMGSMAGGAIAGVGGLAGGAAKWGAGVAANKTTAGAAAYRAYSALKGMGKVK